MRSCLAPALALASLVVLAAAAPAEIYKWTDPDGVVHFTSNPDEVPADQRAAAAAAARAGKGSFQRGVVPSASGASSAPRAGDAPAAAPAARRRAGPAARTARGAEPAEERAGGKTEAEWRAEAQKYRDAMARLEGAAERCKGDRFRYTEGAGRRAYDEEMAEANACQKVRDEIDMNRRWLERLEERAHAAGVPPGWIRD